MLLTLFMLLATAICTALILRQTMPKPFQDGTKLTEESWEKRVTNEDSVPSTTPTR